MTFQGHEGMTASIFIFSTMNPAYPLMWSFGTRRAFVAILPRLLSARDSFASPKEKQTVITSTTVVPPLVTTLNRGHSL